MRISTADIFGNGIAAIQREQSALARTQEQLSTGKRMLSPSDDPGGAVQSLKLRERIAAVEQYARNANLGANRLQHEESILEQIGTSLQRVRELTVQAANATQTGESRAAIARELRQIGSGLLDAANTRDANGEYLFAGFRSAAAPFVTNGAGDVDYVGDAGQRHVQISPDRSVAVGDSGAALMQIPVGNGVFTVTPALANTGTGVVSAADVVDPNGVAAESFTIRFVAADSYEVLDGVGTVVAVEAYAPGGAIGVGGRSISLAGEPAAGDEFAVEPAGSTSLFAIVNDLAAALENPEGDPAAGAARSHAINSALQNVDQALDRVLDLRTGVGARLNAIESHGIVSEDHKVQLQTVLSSVEDLDYAEAISRFTLQQVALQAAQQTYVQLGRMSLFNYL